MDDSAAEDGPTDLLDEIAAMRCQALHLEQGTFAKPVSIARPADIVVPLDLLMVQLPRCKLSKGEARSAAAGPAPPVLLNQALLDARFLDPATRKFQRGFGPAVIALLPALPGFPSTFTPSLPSSASRRRHACDGRAPDAAADGVDAEAGAPDSGGNGGEAGAECDDAGAPQPTHGGGPMQGPNGPMLGTGPAPAPSMAMLPVAEISEEEDDGEGGSSSSSSSSMRKAYHVSPGGRRWPADSSRHASKVSPKNSNSTRGLDSSVHADADWFVMVCCAQLPNGCPGACMLLKPWGKAELHVRFKCGCEHTPHGNRVGQLRGLQRELFADEARGRKGAHMHVRAASARPPLEQLGKDVSRCGSSAQVARQAIMEQRKAKYQYAVDVGESLRLRKAHMEDADKTSTPVSDQARRLFYGDTPLFAELQDGHLLLLQVTEAQLRAWMYCRKAPGVICRQKRMKP